MSLSSVLSIYSEAGRLLRFPSSVCVARFPLQRAPFSVDLLRLSSLSLSCAFAHYGKLGPGSQHSRDSALRGSLLDHERPGRAVYRQYPTDRFRASFWHEQQMYSHLPLSRNRCQGCEVGRGIFPRFGDQCSGASSDVPVALQETLPLHHDCRIRRRQWYIR